MNQTVLLSNLELAVQVVMSGALPIRKASTVYNIPKSTLGDYIKRSKAQITLLQKEEANFGQVRTNKAKNKADSGRTNVRATEQFEPHTAQAIILDSSARFKVVVAGRRWGKSTLARHIALSIANSDNDKVVWWVAPTYAISKQAYRATKKILNRSWKAENKVELSIELNNGSCIWFKSAELYENLVGEGIDYLVMDECGIIEGDCWHESLRPSLMDKKGCALFIGTPKGRNWFFDLYMRGQDKKQKEYRSWSFQSETNPYLPSSEIEETKKTMPEQIYRQEILAEFVDDVGCVFTNVSNCIEGDLQEPQPNTRYVIGVDLARKQDYTVMIVINTADRHVVGFKRIQTVQWTQQRNEITYMAKKYNNASLIVDATGVGDPIVEDLIRDGMHVVPYVITTLTKTQLIQTLMLTIEREEISFPEIDELVNELKSFTYDITSMGHIRYHAPAGCHDDCVLALALANIECPHQAYLQENYYAGGSRYVY